MKKIVNFRPMVMFAIVFAIAICLTVWSISVGFLPLVIAFGVVFISSVIIAILSKQTKTSVYAVITTIVFLLGVLISLPRINNYFEIQKYADGENHLVCGQIYQTKVKDNGEYYIYNLNQLSIDNKSVIGGIRVISYGEMLFDGNVVSFNSKLNKVKDENILFSLVENYSLNSYPTKIQVDSDNADFFISAKRKIKSILFDTLKTQAGFCFALMTGDTGFIAESEMQNYRYSGIAHVFAVSGLHIAFLTVILSVVFEFFKIKRFKKFVLITLLTVLYCGICGWTPSAVRAVIMGSTLLLAESFGKKYDMLNSIALSSMLVLFANPFDILGAGFVLSFSCVIAIALWESFFKRKLHFCNEKFSKSVSVALSVQFGVMPIMCYYFGNISLVSILLNLIAIPLVNVLCLILLPSVIIVAVFPNLNALLIVSEIFSSVITGIMSHINFSKLVLNTNLSVFIVIIYYLIALFASDKLNFSEKKKNVALFSALGWMLLFAL